MKKKVFWKFESDDSYESIGVAKSCPDAEKAVRYFVPNLDESIEVEVESTKEGYFVTVLD